MNVVYFYSIFTETFNTWSSVCFNHRYCPHQDITTQYVNKVTLLGRRFKSTGHQGAPPRLSLSLPPLLTKVMGWRLHTFTLMEKNSFWFSLQWFKSHSDHGPCDHGPCDSICSAFISFVALSVLFVFPCSVKLTPNVPKVILIFYFISLRNLYLLCNDLTVTFDNIFTICRTVVISCI